MKKTLFMTKVLAYTSVGALTIGSMTAQAGLMDGSATLQTYTDFGQNRGRYVVGDKVNALLEQIRADEKGIGISYTDGSATYYIPLEQGMIDFSGIIYAGSAAAISPTFISSVNHIQQVHPTYSERVLDKGHAIRYSTIDITDSEIFHLTPGADYTLARQSKIVTDAVWNPMTTITNPSELVGSLAYRAGGGDMSQLAEDGKTHDYLTKNNWGAYITGGINKIVASNALGDGSTALAEWASGGNPLSNIIDVGDSGSPIYIYNSATSRYEYLGAAATTAVPGGQYTATFNSNPAWAHDTMESFNEKVDMSNTDVVYLNEIGTYVRTETDKHGNSGTVYSGVATDASGNTIATYQGTHKDSHTWANMSDLKDQDTWYAYESYSENKSYLIQSVENLFFTENLIFTASKAKNSIILNATVDLGVGYAEFNSAGEGVATEYTISSAAGGSYQFNHAGYVINKDVDVHLQLVNPADYMAEWRKNGAGNLWIEGSGDTNALLNLGGSGITYLNQQNGGHAAYNVLLSTGATVQLVGGINQIERNLTFGAGGGKLDLYGNSLTWDNSDAVEEDGFTIHALTEEAVITNTTGTTVLEIVNPGSKWDSAGAASTFLGSFCDTAEGALVVNYNGIGDMTMHGIHTDLLNNADSAFNVLQNKVTLVGTNTVHGDGSLNGKTEERYVNTEDWHYADAGMNVNISADATFELGNHARLEGDVTVAEGGTYIMREGVIHNEEIMEGGATKQDVTKYSDFYGQKGDIQLDKGAELQIHYNAGVDSDNEYAGKISGEGDASVALGNDGATLHLTGSSDFSGTKTLSSGTMIAKTDASLGDTSTNKWVVETNGFLAVESATSTELAQDVIDNDINGSSTGTLALVGDKVSIDILDISKHQNLFIGALEGSDVYYGKDTDTLQAYNDAWRLGGGGGTLTVDAILSGGHDLLVGTEYATGTLILTNGANELGSVTVADRMTFLNYGGGVVEDMTVVYTARANGTDNSRITADSRGVLLLDASAMENKQDMTATPYLAIGTLNDATLKGEITVAEKEAYRFGGLDGVTLTVDSFLSGTHDLIVDAQTYKDGVVKLTQENNLTGVVSVMGYDPAYTDNKTGNITLSFGVDNGIKMASEVKVYDGGTIDVAGTKQSFANLTMYDGAIVKDSAADNAKGSLEVEGELLFAEGGTSTFDGVALVEKNGGGFEAKQQLAGSTIVLTGGANLRTGSYLAVTNGTLNITAGADGTGGTLYVDGLRLADAGGQAATMNVGANTHVVVTGQTGDRDGSFVLSHWPGATQLNVAGTLTSNAVITSWDSYNVSLNVKDGGTLNLIKGLTRNDGSDFKDAWGARTNPIKINAESGSAIYAAGGTEHSSLQIDLQAGSTLGGITEKVAGTAVFSNSISINTNGSAKAVTFDTDVKTVDSYSYTPVQGVGGNLVLDGEVDVQGSSSIHVKGSGALWLADGDASSATEGIAVSAMDKSAVASISGIEKLDRSGATVNLGGKADSYAVVSNSLVDLVAQTSLNMDNVMLADTVQVAGNGYLNANNVVAQVTVGKNAVYDTYNVLKSGTQLTQMGNVDSPQTLTLTEDSSVLHIESSLLDSVQVSGSSVTILLSGVDEDLLDYDLVSLSFKNLSELAQIDTKLSITLVDQATGDSFTNSYYMTQSDDGYTSVIYFAVPEPTTATLSLVALAALAARRRRNG